MGWERETGRGGEVELSLAVVGEDGELGMRAWTFPCRFVE